MIAKTHDGDYEAQCVYLNISTGVPKIVFDLSLYNNRLNVTNHANLYSLSAGAENDNQIISNAVGYYLNDLMELGNYYINCYGGEDTTFLSLDLSKMVENVNHSEMSESFHVNSILQELFPQYSHMQICSISRETERSQHCSMNGMYPIGSHFINNKTPIILTSPLSEMRVHLEECQSDNSFCWPQTSINPVTSQPPSSTLLPSTISSTTVSS